MIFNHWKALFDSFKDLWSNKGIFFAYLFPFAIILGIYAYLLDGNPNLFENKMEILLSNFVWTVATAFSNAGLFGCAHKIERDEPTDAGDFLSFSFKNLLQYGFYTLAVSIIFGIGALIAFFIVGGEEFGIRYLVAIVFYVLYTMFFHIKLVFAMPAISDKKNFVYAIITSWKSSFDHSFGTALFLVMGSLVYAVIGALILTVAGALFLIPLLPIIFIILGPLFMVFGMASLTLYLTKSYIDRDKHTQTIEDEVILSDNMGFLDRQH